MFKYTNNLTNYNKIQRTNQITIQSEGNKYKKGKIIYKRVYNKRINFIYLTHQYHQYNH